MKSSTTSFSEMSRLHHAFRTAWTRAAFFSWHSCAVCASEVIARTTRRYPRVLVQRELKSGGEGIRERTVASLMPRRERNVSSESSRKWAPYGLRRSASNSTGRAARWASS